MDIDSPAERTREARMNEAMQEFYAKFDKQRFKMIDNHFYSS
jgi:hypothetical protein